MLKTRLCFALPLLFLSKRLIFQMIIVEDRSFIHFYVVLSFSKMMRSSDVCVRTLVTFLFRAILMIWLQLFKKRRRRLSASQFFRLWFYLTSFQSVYFIFGVSFDEKIRDFSGSEQSRSQTEKICEKKKLAWRRKKSCEDYFFANCEDPQEMAQT